MSLIRTVLTSCLGLALCGGAALAESAATPPGAKPMMTLQMPALPDPVKVELKSPTTALLVFDVVDPTCTSQPRCTGEMVPAIASLLARARKAGVFVLYSTRAPTASKWLPEVAPGPGDPVVLSFGQDRFYNTDLDKMLKARGITTLVLTGWKVSGSVLYTSVGATLRDFTVVIPVDASLAPAHEIPIGIYQILNQNSANATNEPLKPRASTLSRSNMITFQ